MFFGGRSSVFNSVRLAPWDSVKLDGFEPMQTASAGSFRKLIKAFYANTCLCCHDRVVPLLWRLRRRTLAARDWPPNWSTQLKEPAFLMPRASGTARESSRITAALLNRLKARVARRRDYRGRTWSMAQAWQARWAPGETTQGTEEFFRWICSATRIQFDLSQTHTDGRDYLWPDCSPLRGLLRPMLLGWLVLKQR